MITIHARHGLYTVELYQAPASASEQNIQGRTFFKQIQHRLLYSNLTPLVKLHGC